MKCRCSNCGWLEINPSGAMFCGYSDERTWENESCLAWKDKDETKTNADRFRSMTDEEMAEWFAGHDAGLIANVLNNDYVAPTKGCWLEWLKEESDETNEQTN